MAAKRAPQRFIVLPPRGITTASVAGNAHLGGFLSTMAATAGVPNISPGEVKVIDSTHENGIKLVEATPEGLMALKAEAPGLRIVPEVFYDTARAPVPRLSAKAKTKSGTTPATALVKVVDTVTGIAVAGATVVAFTDFSLRIGASGKTRKDGIAQLAIGGKALVERLYVYPRDTWWPVMRKAVQLPLATPVELPAIDLGVPDVLQYFLASMPPGGDGTGVTVGVIDTGCGPHPHLDVAGGMNTVVGEEPTAYADNGDQHGTHVAGIIASRGSAPAGMKGIAPQVALRSYCVFPKGGRASNYSISKAIDQAVADGCDLINMSLGALGLADPATTSSIADARSAGVAVICASGNDGKPEVAQPGADARAVAVGCFGRAALYPPHSVSASRAGRPLGDPDTRFFMAEFSNHGLEIDMVGPGVGVVSTVPTAAWAVMDGTSMASPAVTGMIARLLSADAAVRNMPRTQERSDAILKLAFQAAKKIGFGPEYEGNGWIH